MITNSSSSFLDSPFLEVSLHVGLDGGDLHDDPLLLAVAHVHQLLRRRLWKSNWKSKMAINLSFMIIILDPKEINQLFPIWEIPSDPSFRCRVASGSSSERARPPSAWKDEWNGETAAAVIALETAPRPAMYRARLKGGPQVA